MFKKSKKAIIALVAASLVTGAAFTLTTIKADEVYDDASIGISSAIDRYIELVQLDADKLIENTEEKTEVKTTKKKNNKKAKADGEAVVKEEECKYPQFEGKCLTIVDDYVNIRAEADENSEIIGTLAARGIATVVDKGDEWTQIESGSCKGYIKSELLTFGDDAGEFAKENCSRIATVTADTLNVRAVADIEADLVTAVALGESYYVVDSIEGWVGIAVDETTFGYVSEDYVELSFAVVEAVSVEEAEALRAAEEAQAQEEEQTAQEEEETPVETTTEAPYEEPSTEATTEAATDATTEATTEQSYDVPSSGDTGVDLANFALQFVGNPYVYGGSSLTNGADCSGFVMAVYAEYGYSLPHSAGMQSGYGVEVKADISTLEPGDLIFYGSYSIEHVAIYTGGGMVVHASTTETGIKTSNYDYRTPYKAVRILGQ